MPDDQAVELALGAGHGLQDAFQHLGAQRVVLGDDRQDGHARIHVGQVPKAHAFVFPDGDATVVGRFAEYALGIDLAAVHRQGRARMQLAAARRIRTLGRVHALAGGLQRPGGQGLSLMARPAAMSSATAWAICCQPAACQVSNGPWAQPKPQRMARSRSRALSATLASCAAL